MNVNKLMGRICEISKGLSYDEDKKKFDYLRTTLESAEGVSTINKIEDILNEFAKARILRAIKKITEDTSVEKGMLYIPNTKDWAVFKCTYALDIMKDDSLFDEPYEDKEYMTEGDCLGEEWEKIIDDMISKAIPV